MNALLVTERVERGLSIDAAAAAMDVTAGVVRRAERGLGVHPSNRLKIAEFYGLRVTDIWPVRENGGST